MKRISLLALFLLCACFEDNRTPESALKDFIDLRMGAVVSREEVLKRVTGAMKVSLESITDEEFNQFADLRNVERESFKVLSKSCQQNKCFLTYSLMYKTKQDDKAAYSSEVKKIAEIQQEDGKWLIADVTNIKTYHESVVPINAMEDQAQ